MVSDRTVVLVLGSFPGAASLAQQYYGHPQNHFWRILQSPAPAPLPPAGPQHYAQRCAWLLERRLGLWDVYASCEREGSLTPASATRWRRSCCANALACAPSPTMVGKASSTARRCGNNGGRHPGAQVQSVRLPSTSPANASWSFERKQTAWAELMAAHGLF